MKNNQPLLTHFYLNNDVAITFDHRTMGTNPFRVLLVPLRPTCGQSMGPKSMGHFGYFPRKINLKKNHYIGKICY